MPATARHRIISVIGAMTALALLIVTFYSLRDTTHRLRSKLVWWRPAHRYVIRDEYVLAEVSGFRDRTSNKVPFFEGPLSGMPGDTTRVKVYDEARYVISFELESSHQEELRLESHSSGITKVDSLLGTVHNVDAHLFRLTPQIVRYMLRTTEDGNAAIVHHYVNAFQLNRSGTGYESDGGVHINYPTRHLQMIFDLRTPHRRGQIVGMPTFFLVHEDGTSDTLESEFSGGVAHLLKGGVGDLMPGDRVLCNWTWDTEADGLRKAQLGAASQ